VHLHFRLSAVLRVDFLLVIQGLLLSNTASKSANLRFICLFLSLSATAATGRIFYPKSGCSISSSLSTNDPIILLCSL